MQKGQIHTGLIILYFEERPQEHIVSTTSNEVLTQVKP
jgi:hypothetical protein